MVTKNNLLFIFSHLFISFKELIFIIIPQYIYEYDISYYTIMSFIFQNNVFVELFYTLVRYF